MKLTAASNKFGVSDASESAAEVYTAGIFHLPLE